MAKLNDKRLQEIRSTVARLLRAKIKVGFFDPKSAQLAAFAVFGTINAPARDFIRPALESPAAAKAQARVMRRVYAGKLTAKGAADELAQSIRKIIIRRLDIAHVWAAPLAASTVAKKGHAQPLVDSKGMRDALRVEVIL